MIRRFISMRHLRESVTADELRELFSYNPDTGVITRAKASGRFPAGSIPGSLHRKLRASYWLILVYGRGIYAHRLAWFLHYGVWPINDVDHIDGDSLNNRISNLRDVVASENNKNLALPANNTSGRIGVYKEKTGKWEAQINIQKKRIRLGRTKTRASR